MAFQDKSIQCSDCGATFTFSAQDQEFFQSKGYTNEPNALPFMPSGSQAERGNAGGYSGGARQMFPATCASCGKATEVPFQPRGDKPVYCSDCYRAVKR
jgi:CxxC-x17-CxxC domain-containing protein